MLRRRRPDALKARPTAASAVTAALMALVAGLGSGAARAERYEVTATSALALDREGGLVQSWAVDCVGDNAVEGAAVTLSGKDLRFFLADEEPLEVGVDGVSYALGESTGQYRYRAVPGSRVIARLDVRCGGPVVFDAVVVDSAPVIVPPVLAGPESVVDIVDLSERPADGLIVGRTVELTGLRIEASPRGTEVVTVTVAGAGLDEAFTLVADDFSDGSAVIAPSLTPNLPGEIVVTAELLGAVSSSLRLQAVIDNDLPGNDEQRRSEELSSCGAGGLPGGLVLVGIGVRRRRHATVHRAR